MNDYHDSYLKCDASLLADVFEEFKNKSIKNYRLCLSHYLSVPALSWKAMFNMTKVELGLFQILTCTYPVKKVREVKFLIFLIDILKPTISI